jgi:hypothetical protein
VPDGVRLTRYLTKAIHHLLCQESWNERRTVLPVFSK